MSRALVSRSTGPAPTRSASLKISRNMAKFSEIRCSPRSPQASTSDVDHELHQPVHGLRIAPHQVQRNTPHTPRHERQQPAYDAVGVPRDHHHAPRVGRIAEPPERHREPALGLRSTPLLGELDVLRKVCGRQVAVPDHLGVVPGPLDPGDRLPDRPHRPALEREVGDVDDRLVAHRERSQAGIDVRVGGLLARRQHGGGPAVRARLGEPALDRAGPGGRIAEWVATGQADPVDHPVGDRGLVAGGEDDRLVPPGGEVPERVPLAVQQEQPPDLELLGLGQVADPADRAEEDRERDHQRGGRDRADRQADPAVALVAAPILVAALAEGGDDGPADLLPLTAQRLREDLGQGDADRDRDQQAGTSAPTASRRRTGRQPGRERAADRSTAAR